MRVLIVDDETRAREKLRRMLELHEGVLIVGEASNGAQALDLIARLRPSVLFLDVQMPLRDGFGVIASLPAPAPAVVFVTAYEQHAVRAFDVDAADYLLKPVSTARLSRALQRLRSATSPVAGGAGESAERPRLLICDRGCTTLLDCAEITWLQAEGNYVRVHARGRSFLMRGTLERALKEIGPGFARIHRGVAVQLARVEAVRARSKGDASVVIHGDLLLPCSRQYRASLMERLRNR